MKLLLATTAVSLLMAAGTAPVAAEDVAPTDAPVWMASVVSLANDDGLALTQDAAEDEDDCDDEDEDDADDSDDDDDADDADDADDDSDDEEDDEECDADEDDANLA